MNNGQGIRRAVAAFIAVLVIAAPDVLARSKLRAGSIYYCASKGEANSRCQQRLAELRLSTIIWECSPISEHPRYPNAPNIGLQDNAFVSSWEYFFYPDKPCGAHSTFHGPPPGACLKDDSCEAVVDALHRVPMAPNDRTNGFTQTQTCIAEKACSGKSELDNPAWLDRVVSAFVDPYLDRSGEWPEKIEGCRLYHGIYPPEANCQEVMATYHITADLKSALNKYGCGNDRDWARIGKDIAACVGPLFNDWPPLARNFGMRYANKSVRNMRNKARGECIEFRKARGLPVDANKK